MCTNVLKVHWEFKSGRVEYEPRSGRPKTSITTAIIEQVHNIDSEDPGMKLLIGISVQWILYILNEELRVKKLFGVLLPHSLTIVQKLTRKQISQHYLNENKIYFETMDGTWIYHRDHKLKQEQFQWAEADEKGYGISSSE